MTIKEATVIHIPIIQDIAEKTWWPTYSPIISVEQIRYMLGEIYSRKTLSGVIRDKSQQFIILYDENGHQGFAAYGPRPEDPGVYKLHKIYILPENHAKGYGTVLLDEVIRRVATLGSNVLDLNVNRHNSARSFYERMGFKVIREEDVAIGPYWMNDYVMRLEIADGPQSTDPGD
jgi:GNAT superfamily N-acetyltransferase